MHPNYQKLVSFLRGMDSALVAFSGGVDSSLLLAAAMDGLGDRVLAVTVESVLHPAQELNRARRIAEDLGARHLVVKIDELGDPAFAANPVDRCYLCKSKRMIELKAMAERFSLVEILEGSNADDLSDVRPGLRAIKEHRACSPFIQLGLNKATIRRLAKERGLSTWDLPSNACLASRVPYGELITLERLQRIEKAEKYLRKLGFYELRVRDHRNLARVEVGLRELHRFTEEKLRQGVVSELQAVGYRYICLDLKGYRTGSMNITGAMIENK